MDATFNAAGEALDAGFNIAGQAVDKGFEMAGNSLEAKFTAAGNAFESVLTLENKMTGKDARAIATSIISPLDTVDGIDVDHDK